MIIADGLVGVVLAPGDFAEAVGDLERVGVGLLQPQIVGARGGKAVAVEIGDGAVEERVVVVGLNFQHAAQGGDGGVVIFKLNGNVAPAVKPGRVVGRGFQFAVNHAERVGEQSAHYVGLRGGGEQIIVVRVEGHFGIEQFRAAGEIGFLEISGGGEQMQLGFIGVDERKFFRVRQRVAQHIQRALGGRPP